MSAHPVGLQVSGPAAWDKATINFRAVQRARGTKGSTCCPCPQTRTETNVTGLAQNGIIRPVSLNTFTYLRALSALCFVLAQEERRAWMEEQEEVGTRGDVSVYMCVCVCNERKTQGGRKGSEQMQWTKEAAGFHSDGLSSENTTAFVRDGRSICVSSPHTDARRSCWLLCFVFLLPPAPFSPPLFLLSFLGSF